MYGANSFTDPASQFYYEGRYILSIYLVHPNGQVYDYELTTTLDIYINCEANTQAAPTDILFAFDPPDYIDEEYKVDLFEQLKIDGSSDIHYWKGYTKTYELDSAFSTPSVYSCGTMTVVMEEYD